MSLYKITYTTEGQDFHTIVEFPDMFDAFNDAKEGLALLKKDSINATLKEVEELDDSTTTDSD